MESVTRVMVFSEEPMLAYGIRCLLEAQPLVKLSVSASSPDSLLEMVEAFRPEVLLMDFLAGATPVLMSELANAAPGCKVIALASGLSPETAHQLRSRGVFSILRRSCTPDELLSAVNNATTGAVPAGQVESEPLESGQAISLSPREGQLVSLLAQGLKNKEIAQCLGISEGTVKVYLSKLFQKTGVNDRFELALYGLRNSAHLLTTAGNDEKTESRPERNHVPVLRSVWLRRRPEPAQHSRRVAAQARWAAL